MNKIAELLKTYDSELFKLGVDPKQCEDFCGQVGAHGFYDEATKLGHVRWMIYQMQDNLEKWNSIKTNRWLGFIQGILWSSKLRGIVELRNESRNLNEQQN